MADETNDADNPDDGLTPTQREAVRLDFLGGSCRSIGAAVGVARTTVWAWKQLPAYQRHLLHLQAEADKETLAEVAKTRGEALRITRAGLGLLGRRMARTTGKPMSDSDLSSATRTALEVFKTTAAQTGMGETMKLEHGGRLEVSKVSVVLTSEAEAAIFGDEPES